MAERLIQVIVDDDLNTVRFIGTKGSDQTFANIAAAALHEIIRGSKSEANKEKAAEVMRALGVIRVEEIPSN